MSLIPGNTRAFAQLKLTLAPLSSIFMRRRTVLPMLRNRLRFHEIVY